MSRLCPCRPIVRCRAASWSPQGPYQLRVWNETGAKADVDFIDVRSPGGSAAVEAYLLRSLVNRQGTGPAHWMPGIRTGAVREGERLYLSLEAPGATKGTEPR